MSAEAREARSEASARTAATAAAATILVLAAISWVLAVRQMSGMDMGVATALGSVGFFLGGWVPMMAAMMLPGAAPVVFGLAERSRRPSAVPLFLASYLAVWTLFGLTVYAFYRPHGTFAAGLVAIAAGVYEFTPLKQYFRRRCHQEVGTGFEYALYCMGSTIGLMALLIAVGVMSVGWMCAIAAVVLGQKLLPATVRIDVLLGLAMVGLGILILFAPSAIPGLTPPM
jgi:predicted metal-binding membrane protein